MQWEIAYEWRVFHGKIIGKLVGGLEHVLFLFFSLPIKNGDIPYIYKYIYTLLGGLETFGLCFHSVGKNNPN